jgi:uncharacterized protein YkwD
VKNLLRSPWVLGTLLVVAIAGASGSALVFQGRGDGSSPAPARVETDHRVVPTTSTSTTTTTTTTVPPTTTTAPPPAPAPVDTPAPAVDPAPDPAPAPPPPSGGSPCDGSGSAIIDAMNRDRGANGLGGLCGNGALSGYAQAWANWMAQNQTMVHQDLNSILSGTGFSTIGENLLVGPGGMPADQMEAAWMASPGHRANILNGAYSAAGVGIAYSSDGRVWVCVDFGG